MQLLCKWFGHRYIPYRYNTVEYMPTKKDTPFNREGAYILSHVYCSRCGIVKEVTNNGDTIRYKQLHQER